MKNIWAFFVRLRHGFSAKKKGSVERDKQKSGKKKNGVRASKYDPVEEAKTILKFTSQKASLSLLLIHLNLHTQDSLKMYFVERQKYLDSLK